VAAVLNLVNSDIAQITDLLVTAHVPNIGQVAAGVHNVNIAVLADDLLGLSRVLFRSNSHDGADS